MQNDPLDQLRDVQLPDTPTWWPPAPGWWIVAVVVLLLLAWLINSFVQRRRRSAPRRAALRELDACFNAWQSGTRTATDCINDCNALLKRLWVHVDGATHVAALSGDEWLAYLDRRSASRKFTGGAGRLLGNQRFSSVSDDSERDDAELPALQPLLRKLLRSAAVTT